MPLSKQTLDLMAKLVPRLGSDSAENERLAALNKIEAALKRDGESFVTLMTAMGQKANQRGAFTNARADGAYAPDPNFWDMFRRAADAAAADAARSKEGSKAQQYARAQQKANSRQPESVPNLRGDRVLRGEAASVLYHADDLFKYLCEFDDMDFNKHPNRREFLDSMKAKAMAMRMQPAAGYVRMSDKQMAWLQQIDMDTANFRQMMKDIYAKDRKP